MLFLGLLSGVATYVGYKIPEGIQECRRSQLSKQYNAERHELENQLKKLTGHPLETKVRDYASDTLSGSICQTHFLPPNSACEECVLTKQITDHSKNFDVARQKTHWHITTLVGYTILLAISAIALSILCMPAAATGSSLVIAAYVASSIASATGVSILLLKKAFAPPPMDTL